MWACPLATNGPCKKNGCPFVRGSGYYRLRSAPVFLSPAAKGPFTKTTFTLLCVVQEEPSLSYPSRAVSLCSPPLNNVFSLVNPTLRLCTFATIQAAATKWLHVVDFVNRVGVPPRNKWAVQKKRLPICAGVGLLSYPSRAFSLISPLLFGRYLKRVLRAVFLGSATIRKQGPRHFNVGWFKKWLKAYT